MVRTRRSVMTTLGAGLALFLSGCGTIFYPERKGRTGGRIDPGIVLLNGIGLIFFLVPGIVAFAVDFATGAIYLAPGEEGILGANLDTKDLRQRQIALPVTAQKIETLLEQEIGHPVDLGDSQWQDARDWSSDRLYTALLSARRAQKA